MGFLAVQRYCLRSEAKLGYRVVCRNLSYLLEKVAQQVRNLLDFKTPFSCTFTLPNPDACSPYGPHLVGWLNFILFDVHGALDGYQAIETKILLILRVLKQTLEGCSRQRVR